MKGDKSLYTASPVYIYYSQGYHASLLQHFWFTENPAENPALPFPLSSHAK